MEPLNHDAVSAGRWKREHATLERRLETARTFHGLTASAAPVGQTTHLRRGERLFLFLERAALIEPRARSVDNAPALDRGTVTVTDRRVVFEGTARKREWAFPKLVEHHHYERPAASMLEVSNRVRVSGFAYDSAQAADVRFFLDLALAHHADRVEALQHEIERQLIRHDAHRPGVHAGAWVWRGWARPIPVASALLTVIAISVGLLAGGDGDSSPPRALDARGGPAASVDVDLSRDLDSSDPVVVSPPEPAPTGAVGRSSRPAPTPGVAPTPAPTPGCATVAVIGPLAIPDPLCSVNQTSSG